MLGRNCISFTCHHCVTSVIQPLLAQGAQVWVCLWEWRTTILPFLVNLGMELQQLLWQSLRDISKQLFFWHQAHTFLEAQLFLQSRVKYFPTFALSSFQMPEMESAAARKQQQPPSLNIWISDTNRCCPWKPNRNHHTGVTSMLHTTHYPTGPPASKTPHPKPFLNARSCWKAQKQLWHTLIYIYTYMCICLLTCTYTYKYIHRQRKTGGKLLACLFPSKRPRFLNTFSDFLGKNCIWKELQPHWQAWSLEPRNSKKTLF